MNAPKPVVVPAGTPMLAALADIGIRPKATRPGHPQYGLLCPRCEGGGSREESLTLTVDPDALGAVWCCHRGTCGWTGNLIVSGRRTVVPFARAQRDVRPPPLVPLEDQRKPTTMYEWFADRGIAEDTVDAFGCYTLKHWFFAKGDIPEGFYPGIVFPYIFDRVVVNRKYRTRHKQMMQEKDPLHTFYNVDSIIDTGHVVVVEGECFPPDAAVLTPRGWVAFSDLLADDLVAQWDNDVISFVVPTGYTRKTVDRLLRLEKNGYVSVTTPSHGLIRRRRSTGRIEKVAAHSLGNDARWVIPRAGRCDGAGVDLSIPQIQLALAVSADASIDIRKNTGKKKCSEARYVRFGLKKERKIERLRGILHELGINASDQPIGNGYTSICFPLPDWVPGRLLPWSWIAEFSSNQRAMVLEELIEWDGNHVLNRNQTEFSSKHDHMAVWVQALAHTSGFCSTVIHRRNEYGAWLKVSLLHGKSYTSTQNLRRSDVAYSGEVFCVTVPSGAILVRQEERVTVSGNCDALACHQAGWKQVVSLKDGAPDKVRAEDDPKREFDRRYEALATHADLLEKIEKFYLAGDMDEPGIALREELARRLGRHRCWIVTWPKGCKDAGDTLKQCGEDAVSECLHNAKPYPIDDVQQITGEALDDYLEKPAPPVMTTGMTALDRVVRLPGEGRLIIVTGIPSSGKSQLTMAIMMHLMLRENRRFLVFSPEMQPWEEFATQCAQVLVGKTARRDADWQPGQPVMTREERRNAGDWMNDRLRFLACDSEDKPPCLEWILDRAKQASLRLGLTDLLLDPWNEIEHQRGGLTETDYTGRALQKLKAFGFRHGCNIWIIAHPTKMRPPLPGDEPVPPGPYDISGSSHWSNKADVGMTIHTPHSTTQVILWKARFKRWGKKNDSTDLLFDPATGRYASPDSIQMEHGYDPWQAEKFGSGQ